MKLSLNAHAARKAMVTCPNIAQQCSCCPYVAQQLLKNSVGSIGDVQSAAEGVASDAQSKALNNPIADGAKTFLNKVAGVPDPQLNPIEDGKQLINKNIGN